MHLPTVKNIFRFCLRINFWYFFYCSKFGIYGLYNTYNKETGVKLASNS